MKQVLVPILTLLLTLPCYGEKGLWEDLSDEFDQAFPAKTKVNNPGPLTAHLFGGAALAWFYHQLDKADVPLATRDPEKYRKLLMKGMGDFREINEDIDAVKEQLIFARKYHEDVSQGPLETPAQKEELRKARNALKEARDKARQVAFRKKIVTSVGWMERSSLTPEHELEEPRVGLKGLKVLAGSMAVVCFADFAFAMGCEIFSNRESPYFPTASLTKIILVDSPDVVDTNNSENTRLEITTLNPQSDAQLEEKSKKRETLPMEIDEEEPVEVPQAHIRYSPIASFDWK